MKTTRQAPNYQTLVVTFSEKMGTLDNLFVDSQAWGVSTLKEWIDGYESTRFTPIDERKAVITSEYNMEHVRHWLANNMPVEKQILF